MRWRTVILPVTSLGSQVSSIHLPMGSSKESFPASTRRATAVEVNILFIEPRLNLVSMLLGTWKALLASPAKSVRRTFVPLGDEHGPRVPARLLDLGHEGPDLGDGLLLGERRLDEAGRRPGPVDAQAGDEEARRVPEAEAQAPPASQDAVLDDDHGRSRAFGGVSADGMEIDAARVPQEPEGRRDVVLERDLVPEIPGAFLVDEALDPVGVPGVHDLDQGLDAGPGRALRKSRRVLERRGGLLGPAPPARRGSGRRRE